jgi:DNA-binding response OmpR family regulator
MGGDSYRVLTAGGGQAGLGHIAAVTANSLPQDEVRARAAGFDGFIGKPLDFDRFPAQIRTILSGEAVWVRH